jgi:hypothetical protein
VALSDTARLISEMVLVDKFSANARKYGQSVSTMERQTSTLGRVGQTAAGGIGTAVGNLAKMGVIGVGILGTQVAAGIRSLERLEEVVVATNEVIRSTSGVAGQSAEDIRNLAEKYEGLNATIDDKVIQSAENLLLTFTNIRGQAFEPALEAALNMNQALGGGEEGLQGNLIKVARALNDPIAGLSALGRAGVQFSDEQKDRIQQAVEENRLYDAQQIILDQLATKFGGQFAQAGTTATAKFAKFRDTIEDAQMTLATAFLPVLVKVADKLGEFLAKPETQTMIAELGEGLADAFDQVVELAGRVPWSSVIDAFKIMGTGSKALLDAFVALPPWVQTAVITGWGLNKLTGGALSTIFSTLASGIIRGVLGINAGVVNLKAATVVGGGAAGGAPIAAAGGGVGGVITKILGVVSAGALGALIGSEIGHAVFFDPTVKPAVEFEQSQFDRLVASQDPEKIRTGLRAIEDGLGDLDALGPLKILAGDQYDILVSQRDTLRSILEDLGQPTAPTAPLPSPINQGGTQPVPVAIPAPSSRDLQQSRQFLANIETATGSNTSTSRDVLATNRRTLGLTDAQLGQDRRSSAMRSSESIRGFFAQERTTGATKTAALMAKGDAIRDFFTQIGQTGLLRIIASKNFSPTIIVKTTTNTSISGKTVQSTITQSQLQVGTGPQEF